MTRVSKGEARRCNDGLGWLEIFLHFENNCRGIFCLLRVAGFWELCEERWCNGDVEFIFLIWSENWIPELRDGGNERRICFLGRISGPWCCFDNIIGTFLSSISVGKDVEGNTCTIFPVSLISVNRG